jgi:hypothetical protein
MADEASAPGPGGGLAPRDEPGGADLRASHDDRDQAVEVLRVAAGDGPITAEELDERVGAALTARTYGELAALISDLPVTPGSLPLVPGSLPGSPGAVAKDLVRIECDTSTARRDGPWLVPKRLEVRLNLGTLTLDFTEAVLSWPSLEIDADIQTGSLILVTGPGIFVSTDDLAIQTSAVKASAPGPEIPVRFRIDISGRVRTGTVAVRPPRPPRRPRRTLWQWLLRRRPGPPALPPGGR